MIPTDPDTCPSCGTVCDAVTPIDGESTPKPGDVAICFYCGAFATYDEEVRRRTPTPEEDEAYRAHGGMMMARRTILARIGAPWS